MASIFGHALAGLAAARAPAGEKGRGAFYSWETTAAVAFMAIAPDLDILIWILLRPAGMTPHRGASHSLLVGLGLAVFFWLILSRGGKRQGPRLAMGLGMASLAHPLLDYFMGCGPPVPFLWPWVEKGWLAPIQLVPTAYYSRSLKGLAGLLLDPRSFAGIIFECGIFTPILMAERYSGPGKRLYMWGTCIGISAFFILAVYFIYN